MAGFDIPNLGDASFPTQAEPDSVDFTILTSGIDGMGVGSGCAVTANGLGVDVASGNVIFGSTITPSAGATGVPLSSSATYPMFHLIGIDSDGLVFSVPGTPATDAVFPIPPDETVIIAAVYVPALSSSITDDNIIDKRVFIHVTGGGGGGSTTILADAPIVADDSVPDVVTISIDPATDSTDGSMSAADKTTIDSLGTAAFSDNTDFDAAGAAAAVQTNLNTEAATRAAADTTLQTNITAEASARASADTTLQTNINTEASTRASADTTLQTNINTEASTRATADTTLQANIDAETARAEAAEALKLAIAQNLGDVQSIENSRLNISVGHEPRQQHGIPISLGANFLANRTGIVIAIGDSLVAGGGSNSTSTFTGTNGTNGYIDKIRKHLAAAVGNQSPGRGWLPEYSAVLTAFPYCWGHITGSPASFPCPGTAVNTAGLGASAVQYTTAQAPAPHTDTFNYIKRFYTKRVGGGKFQLKVDGVLDTTLGPVDTSGASTDSGHFVEYFIPTTPTGPNTTCGNPIQHTVEWVFTVGDVIMDGGYLDNLAPGSTNANGTIQVHNGGLGGTIYRNWLSTGSFYPGPMQHITNNPPDHVILCSLGNDINNGLTASQWEADATALVDQIHALNTYCTFDIAFEPLLNFGVGVNPTPTEYLTTWIQAARRVADHADSLTGGYLWDMYQVLGNQSVAANQTFGTQNLLSVIDNFHPNGICHSMLADDFMRWHAPSRHPNRSELTLLSNNIDGQGHSISDLGTPMIIKGPNGIAFKLDEFTDAFSVKNPQLRMYLNASDLANDFPAAAMGTVFAQAFFAMGAGGGALSNYWILSGGQMKAVGSDAATPAKITIAPGTATTDAVTTAQAKGLPRMVTGRWTRSGPPTSTAAFTVGDLIMLQWFVPVASSVASIAVESTAGGGAGSVMLFEIAADVGGLPSTKLYATVTGKASTGTGLIEDTGAAGTIVGPGYFWVGSVAQVAAPTLRVGTPVEQVTTSGSPIGSTANNAIKQTGVTGTMPSPVTGTTLVTGNIPMTYLKMT